MAQTKVRADIHGPYVRTNGQLFRPIMPVGYAHAHPDGTKYAVGNEVNARSISGSELARVGDEVWFTHGSYLGYKAKPPNTEALFKPSHHTWPERLETRDHSTLPQPPRSDPV